MYNNTNVPLGEYYNYFDIDKYALSPQSATTYTIDENNIVTINSIGISGDGLGSRGYLSFTFKNHFPPMIDKPLHIRLRIRLDELGAYNTKFGINLRGRTPYGQSQDEMHTIDMETLEEDSDGFKIVNEVFSRCMNVHYSGFVIYSNANIISVDLNSIEISIEDNMKGIPVSCIPKENLLINPTTIASSAWYKPTGTMPNGSTSLRYIYMLNGVLPYNKELTLYFRYKEGCWISYFYIYSNDPAFASGMVKV